MSDTAMLVQGNMVVAGSVTADSISVGDSSTARSTLAQEDLVRYTVPLREASVSWSDGTRLPVDSALYGVAYCSGTLGTDWPTLQWKDQGGAVTWKPYACAFVCTLPAEYVAGSGVLVRVWGKMLGAVADGSATVAIVAYKSSRDGACGSNLCVTAAQTVNSLASAQRDFAVTSTALAPGDQLRLVLTVAGGDTANAAPMIPCVTCVEVLLSVKG